MSNVNHKSAKERIQDRIDAAKIATRLQAFVLAKPSDFVDGNGDLDEKAWNDAQLSTQQVAGMRILLAKVVPDQKAIEQTIRDERVKTVAEINAGLVANGLDPDTIWQSVRKH